MRESLRVASVQSPIIPIVGQLIRAHPGTISLGQGVVGYGPPSQAIDAIAEFLRDPENNKYQPVHGIAPLLDLIERKLAAENGIDLVGRRVVVTAGGNMGFMNAILAIADSGDEVILQTPYYFNHEMALTMAGCRVVLVGTDEDYQLRPDAIAAAVNSRTRAVVTISPNNPTGAVYREEDLRAVNHLCGQRRIYHIHDEAYENFTYDGVKHFSPGSIESSSRHTISLFSLSKAYGFASWRIGYMLIPEHLFEAVRKIQDTILICPPVISQYAAAGAMRAGSQYCSEKVAEIVRTRLAVQERLAELGGICEVPPAAGAFYYFLRLQRKMDAMELVERLIKEHGVAVIPGTTFGMNDGCFLRLSYGALTRETAAEGVGRLVRGLKAILD